MTREEILEFEKIAAQLDSFYNETILLVKKDPTAEMNTFKLKLINNILAKANSILDDMRPFEDFSEFDLNEMPNNGDVAMILGQYINCLEELKKDNVHKNICFWYWNVDGDVENKEIQTSVPRKFK